MLDGSLMLNRPIKRRVLTVMYVMLDLKSDRALVCPSMTMHGVNPYGSVILVVMSDLSHRTITRVTLRTQTSFTE